MMRRDNDGTDDYAQQPITNYRLRELLQHEKDNHALRAEVQALRAEIENVRATFEAFTVAEVKQYGGIPSHASTPTAVAFRLAVADLLESTALARRP